MGTYRSGDGGLIADTVALSITGVTSPVHGHRFLPLHSTVRDPSLLQPFALTDFLCLATPRFPLKGHEYLFFLTYHCLLRFISSVARLLVLTISRS